MKTFLSVFNLFNFFFSSFVDADTERLPLPRIVRPSYVICFLSKPELFSRPPDSTNCEQTAVGLRKGGFRAEVVDCSNEEPLSCASKKIPADGSPLVVPIGHGKTIDGKHRLTAMGDKPVASSELFESILKKNPNTKFWFDSCFGGQILNELPKACIGTACRRDEYASVKQNGVSDGIRPLLQILSQSGEQFFTENKGSCTITPEILRKAVKKEYERLRSDFTCTVRLYRKKKVEEKKSDKDRVIFLSGGDEDEEDLFGRGFFWYTKKASTEIEKRAPEEVKKDEAACVEQHPKGVWQGPFTAKSRFFATCHFKKLNRTDRELVDEYFGTPAEALKHLIDTQGIDWKKDLAKESCKVEEGDVFDKQLSPKDPKKLTVYRDGEATTIYRARPARSPLDVCGPEAQKFSSLDPSEPGRTVPLDLKGLFPLSTNPLANASAIVAAPLTTQQGAVVGYNTPQVGQFSLEHPDCAHYVAVKKSAASDLPSH